MSQTKTVMLSNRAYDITKRTVTIGLPAIGTLYFAISSIWGLPYADEVVGTIAAITTFLGVVLGISSSAYNDSEMKYDGTIEVNEDEEGRRVASLILKNVENPEDVVNQKEVTFKVVG